MNSQLITVDIPGLDLALGGGIWTVRRLPDARASATLLIRGAPGSGKTAFGTLLAGALGRALEGDVAYGCVELLPVELQAQHANLRASMAREAVVIPPFRQAGTPGGAACRIFAGLLDLGPHGQEPERLGPAVSALLAEVEHAEGRPRVLVIDSLSDGYGLGSAAPRILADALSKLAAERGLVLILLEEIVDSRPSTWSFTADVVLELASGEEERAPGSSAPFERRVTVIKNRFGPSDAGPHRFELLSSGLHIFPRPTAYLAHWAAPLLGVDGEAVDAGEQGWGVDAELPPGWPDFRDCITAVHGPAAHFVFNVAVHMGGTTVEDQPYAGTTLFVDFKRQVFRQRDEELHETGASVIGTGNPYLSGHRLLAMVRDSLDRFRRDGMVIEKVLIGDMRSIRGFWNPDGIRRAIAAIAALLRQARIPLVLFETTSPRKAQRKGVSSDFVSISYLVDTGEPEPGIVDFADVTVEIIPTPKFESVYECVMTDIRSGLQSRWKLNPER